MERNEIIEKLKSLVELGSVSAVEKVYNFPKNNLGKVISGKMELPEKWVKLFSQHFSRQDEEANWRSELKKIGDYCKEKNIQPQQLIDWYETKNKPIPDFKPKNTSNEPPKEEKPVESNVMTLQMIKDMCPKEITGWARSEWIEKKKEELGFK